MREGKVGGYTPSYIISNQKHFMRKLLFKSPESSFNSFDGSVNSHELSEHGKALKKAGDILRCTMEDIPVKMACDMTDRIVLRTASKRV